MTPRDLFLAVLTIFLWGGNIVAIKIGVHEVPPPILLALRFSLTTLVFLPFIRMPERGKTRLLAEISAYMAMHQVLLFFCLRMLDGSTMSILLQSQILFATLLGLLMLKEKISLQTTIGLSVGFIGLLLTLGGPDISRHPEGFVLALVSTVSLALCYIRMRQLKDIRPATLIGLMNGFAAPAAIIFSLVVTPKDWLHLDQVNWINVGLVLFYQVAIVSYSHILWQALLARNEVAKIMSLVLLMPVAGILLSWALLHETLHPALIYGGLLTLVGVAIVTLRRMPKYQAVAADTAL
ncbi:MAG: protein of unknown function transrane [Micavibrio sp.]|nr:protein of unknown function transrane [Micavibrio sp.]